MKKKLVIFAVVVYVLSTATSFGVFAYFAGLKSPEKAEVNQENPDQQIVESTLLEIDPAEPLDQECPLSGQYYTQTERDAWEQRRPLAVMIENHPDSRPHSGLSSSDIVFEIVAEGGVTRFMAMLYCGAQKNDVVLAPIRSARSYFIDYASGFNLPMYVHVGGANIPGPADALGQINKYGWALENDMNQFSIGFPTFVRNKGRLGRDVATEHTMETTTELLWEVAAEREWTNITPERTVGRKTIPAAEWSEAYEGWTFSDEEIVGDADAPEVSHEFWSGYEEYAVKWVYDPESKMYKREMAGEPHTDLNNGQQIMVKNAVVLKTVEKGPIDELKHMLYTTVGTGDALIFTDGMAREVTWSKKSREAELKFLDAKGRPIEMGRGMTWISVVDVSTEVTY